MANEKVRGLDVIPDVDPQAELWRRVNEAIDAQLSEIRTNGISLLLPSALLRQANIFILLQTIDKLPDEKNRQCQHC
jgi:hypothetical protein